MHDIEAVHIVQGKAKLLDHVRCLILAELALLFYHIEEVASSDQLHDDVIVSLVLHELEDTRNVWMLCLFEDCELVPV